MASAVGMAPIINTNSYPSIDSNMNGGEVDKHGKTFPMDAVDDPTYDSDMLPEDTLKGEEDDDYYNGDVLTSKTGAGRTTKLYRGQNGIKGSIGVSPGSNNALLIQPNNVCKVIKGEIHNVLNAMRADSRYVSPLRFVEELPTDEQHPLLLQMRDLHTELGEWELLHYQQRPEPKLYLKPFCAAIQGRDISASVTGAALHAIHKFLLYGFLAHENPESYATIANTLLLCTFEESGEGASARTRITNAVTNNRDDEQVVLKLLDLSALVVRCASHSLDAELIVGLLDTCLHVSHRAKRASPLLKSAASDALGQIVLEVFSNDLMHAREAVLSKLAMLLNPQQNSDAYAVNSLTLVNIALETLQDDLSEREINILSNDLSKYLLQWSTTHDLVILSLTLRVIFNLFQTIRNHLKVPLEVFLTSVHLRILEHSTSAEEREVALESLLEFCQEPALMKDLYLNYDCDVNCTNLYESICTTLGNVAVPSATDAKVTMELDGAMSKDKKAPKLSKHKVDPNKTAEKASLAQAEIPLNALNMFAVDGLTTIIDSIARRCKGNKSSRPADPTDLNRMHSYSSADSLEDDIGAQVTEEELQERKRKKYALTNIAKAFNKDPKGKEWLEIGKEAGIINDTAASVAHVLYSAPGLDKVYIGEYLAKGPKEDYPFEHEVRLAFAKEYDFSNETSFAGALRLYLSKFRMPGEAQCIDRFMEAFSNELYRQQGNNSIFKNADAAFVLAFSTIMLNTDLHNPMIKNISRMTIEQFVKNNRGINDGEDLPEGMLRQLYEEIKANEIQLQREIGEFITKAETKAQDFRSVWGDLLAKNVAAPVFSTAEEARLTMFEAGVHEKDMFLTVAKPAMKALQSAFLRSWDDGTVVNILAGFENMARISTYFSLDKILNDIVSFLLLHGRDYINGVVALEYAGIDSGAPIGGGINDDDDTMSIVDTDSPLPMDLLKTKEIAAIDSKVVDISGAAAYRGIISLNMGLKIVRALFPRIREAWPMLINVFCSLRDARALPEGLADLDDFADSEGNVLPLSKFAKFSQFQLDKMYRGKGEEKVEASGGESKGWFKMFGSREGSDVPTSINLGGGYQGRGEELSSNAKVLLEIAQRTEVEKFMVLGLNVRMSIVKQSVSQFLESADQFPPTPGYAYEQHTAFTLELAARALLMSQERARDLLPMFLAKFTSAIKKCRRGDSVYLPFIVERMVVTVLRTCIHLYSIPAAREQLKPALISLATLPKAKFICLVADRMACGLAIIVQSSFAYFNTAEDWKFIGNIFDTLAHYPTARGLVFDGIASTVEAAVPEPVVEEIHPEALRQFEAQLNSKPALSIPAATEFQKVLFKFMYAAYQKDFSLQAPAILCLEKVLSHLARMQMVLQLDDRSRAAPPDAVPDKEMWQRFAVGLFNAMGSYDQETCQTAYDCFQRNIMTTPVEQITDEKWLSLLKVISTKQAPLQYDNTRVKTFTTFGFVLLFVTPELTQEKENWKPLTELTKQFAIMADENLKKGRGSKELFEKTISTVTTMSNVMGSREFQGERRYSKWASDSLFTVLEKNGAGGGSAKNVALTQKQEESSS